MLPTRRLPPPFLLPAWGLQQLKKLARRAHSSDDKSPPSSKLPPITLPTPPKSAAYSRPKTKRIRKPRSDYSLFAELFPSPAAPKHPCPPVPQVEPFQWKPETKTVNPGHYHPLLANTPDTLDLLKESQSDRQRNTRRGQEGPPGGEKAAKVRRSAIVLKLNLASTTLEESDFFRISPTSRHIAGWRGGIMKIIQGRDANTLEPQGHYFILFTHAAAANAYLEETKRLHAIARSNAGSLRASKLPPPPGLARDSEDVSALLSSFSLVPGAVPLEIGHVVQPYTEGMVSMLSSGGHHFLSRLQGNGEGTVLFSLDAGFVTHSEVEQAIAWDGRRRNLLWKLVDEEGIVPLYEKKYDDMSTREARRDQREYRRPSRYVLSFVDDQEARRFVRDWHRKPFPKDMSRRKSLDDILSTVSAQMMW